MTALTPIPHMSVNYVETIEADGYRLACDAHDPLFFGPIRLTRRSAEEDERLHRMADHPTQPAALTPDDLARIEELEAKATPGPWDADAVRPFAEIASADARFVSAARTAVPALVAGVRSLQARITELETEAVTLRQQRHDNLEAIAARDAVIEDVRGAWTGADIDTVLEAAPASVLASRDAEKWEEGLSAGADRWMDAREFGDAPVNPYREGADQ